MGQEDEPPAGPAAERVEPGTTRATAWLLLATGVLVVSAFLPSISQRFGDSHDGRNGAVWATAAQALRIDGPIESKLGAELADSLTYTNHPPLISLETAVAESVFGTHRAVTRAPAWMGTIVSLSLLWWLMRELAFSPWYRALGLLTAVGCPMLLSYGSMLDTPVTSLPFALACALVWLRHRRAAAGGVLRVVTSFFAVCAGWQAALLATLLTVVDAFRGDRRSAWLGAAGVTTGAVAVLSWQVWATGSIDATVDALASRSGVNPPNDEATLLAAAEQQGRWLLDLLSPPALVAVLFGTVLLIRAEGQRRDAAITMGACISIYSLGLPGGSFIHEYWGFWVLTLVALGAAALTERLAQAVPGSWSSWWIGVAPAGVALTFALLATKTIADQSRVLERGLDGLAALDRVEGPKVWAYRIVSSPGPWITYETGLDVEFIDEKAEVEQLAAADPDAPVLTYCYVLDPEEDDLCTETVHIVVEAQELLGLNRPRAA